MQFQRRLCLAVSLIFIFLLVLPLQEFWPHGKSKEKAEMKELKQVIRRKLISLKKRLDSTNNINLVSYPRKDIGSDILNLNEQNDCSNITILFMITSNAQHFQRRQVVRETYMNQQLWGKYLKKYGVTVAIFFLVGNTIEKDNFEENVLKESKAYGDVILMDLNESFYSLSYKIMIGFQWINENCRFDYLFKGDDDISINMHALVNLIKDNKTPREKLYAGNIFSSSSSTVLRGGRYGITREEWPQESFSDYNSGGGFIMTPDVVNKMIPNYNWINPLKIDDAYIGHLVNKAGMDVTSSRCFKMSGKNCTFIQSVIVLHIDKASEKEKCTRYYNNNSLKLALKEL